MKILIYIVCVIAVATFTSCEKELDFEYHDIEPLTVVEGALTSDGFTARLTSTTPMDEIMDKTPLSDAMMTLVDVTTGEKYPIVADADGVFRSNASGIVGHDYMLTVVHGDNCYNSTTRMLPGTEIVDAAFHWIKMPYDDMAVVQVKFKDNPLTRNYYWIRLYRNGEAYSWSAIADYSQVDGIAEETITTTRRDADEEDDNQVLVDGDVVTVTVTEIDRSMLDYLIALMNGSNGQPQFQGDRCLGYFLASPVASTTLIFHPDEIDYAQ